MMPDTNPLSQIRIVLVNTTLPANIGSAARAMHTMGLSDLVVVAPKHPIDQDSESHAAGAIDILRNAKVVPTLQDATADCHLLFAASSRQRHIPRPVVNPSQAAQLILSRLNNQDEKEGNKPRTAILFGREDRGLTNDELALADYHIQIDANPAYPVLNVASAVQVIASFIYSTFASTLSEHTHSSEHRQGDTANTSIANPASTPMMDLALRQVWDSPAITHEQKLALQSRIIELMHHLTLIDSTDNSHLRDLPSRLSRMLSRLQLDQKEYAILSAIIAKILLKL